MNILCHIILKKQKLYQQQKIFQIENTSEIFSFQIG